jgi:hypothetical protein
VSTVAVSRAPGRSCAGCTLCCKLPSIPEIPKPAQTWCAQCDIGNGCKIYETRPSPCRKFECVYLTSGQLGEHWKPATCHLVIAYQAHVNRIVIHVDNAHPDAWRIEPHYSDMKLMAKSIYPRNGQVVIVNGPDAIAMLPDRDKPLGAYRDDKIFVTAETPGPAGPVYDVFLFEKDDPQLAALRQHAGAVIDRTAPAK